MLDDSTNHVSVDGSTNWGKNAAVAIQHPLPGQVIAPQTAPPAQDQPASPAATDQTTRPESEDKPIILTEGGSYAVSHGDTLDGIAAQHNLTAAQLKALNPELQNQSSVYPGQLLTIQTKQSPATTPSPALTIGPSQSSYTMTNKHELEAAVHKQLSGWLGTADPLNHDKV